MAESTEVILKTVIPEKSLENFTIPKRKHEETEESTDVKPTPVLDNTYVNYPTQGYQQTGDFYGLWYGHGLYNASYYVGINTAPTAYQQLQAGIINTLQQYREEPKNKKCASTGATYAQYLSDTYTDSSLPKELTQLFQPLYCKLCQMQLSSSVMAKAHYKGKNHEKKIKKWLIDYSEKTGEPLHKRAKIVSAKKDKVDDNDPKYYHCDVCDLPLTGRLHAESHYMGKNHQRVLAGKKTPAGKGYYDSSGKWIRITPAKGDPTGRDGFGQDFILPKQEPSYDNMNEVNKPNLRCDLCQVSVTSPQQMEMHYNGQRHKKKLRTLGVTVEPTAANATTSTVAVHAAMGQPEVHSYVKEFEAVTATQDLSAFRTPSGQFYCKICDMTLNSESQFSQHLTSKNHKKNISNYSG